MNTRIKGIRLAALFTILSVATLYAATILSWNIDKPHSSVNFTVTHFFTDVMGQFTEFSGDLKFEPDNLAESTATFTIPVSSVYTGDAARDKDLRSKSFFNVKKFPNITFVSSRFEQREDGTYVVFGNLTIKGVTKKVGLPFKITGRMDHPYKRGTEILGISMTTKIDRTHFGVGTGNWAATTVVGNEVIIRITMELNRKKTTS